MKITKLTVKNFRLLRDFQIDLEENLSLVIGKNNSGKTSLLAVLEKFLSQEQNSFTLNDINLLAQNELKERLDADDFSEGDHTGISLKMYIAYDETDNLKNISHMMLNLNPEENFIVLSFEYRIKPEAMQRLKSDFAAFQADLDDDQKPNKNILYFLTKRHSAYFELKVKALEYNNEANGIDIQDKRAISKVVSFKMIRAKRGVTNPAASVRSGDKALSKLSAQYYEKVSDARTENENTKKLRKQLGETDDQLTKIYEGLFKEVIGKVKRFGGIKEDESKIRILSTLEEKNILKENTSVFYDHDLQTLPEDYNGLGYLNLIAMIFEVEVIISDFKKKKNEFEEPSDINLLFIEEPEAHTHPQMQYVFIKNIKNLLDEERNGVNDGVEISLQTIISTHSCHITAESDFDDIKYFYRQSGNEVVAKNLSTLKEQYADDPKQYQFLTQYLTLNRAEMFFADKVILIEGDTERILFPALMRKIDNEHGDPDIIDLCSQNISVVEVGAYSQIFEKFIIFIGIKTLIVTDLDGVDKDGKPCRVAQAESYSNSALKYFLKGETLKNLKAKTDLELSLTYSSEDAEWKQSEDGLLHIVYQQKEDDYEARSFEDAFIQLNRGFIKNSKDSFKGLKNRDYFDDANRDSYDLAENCIIKKTHFALDILYYSDEDYSNWEIPSYIENGLLWLRR